MLPSDTRMQNQHGMHKHTPITVSLLISTYNWREALALVLRSVAQQSRLPDEVIVADDGSKDDTAVLLREVARNFPVPLRHVWQPDEGFRKARVLNCGIVAMHSDYVIQVDGDMVLHRHFVADHLWLARPGRFLQGTRIRTTKAETARLLAGGEPYFGWFVNAYFRDDADPSTYHYGRRHHVLRLPWLARLKSRASGHPMGCNVSFWRTDLLRVNGYDERMHGYGSEDLELDVRLQNAGLRRSQIKFAALALHLEHRKVSSADPSDPRLPNNQLLFASRAERRIRSPLGIDTHLNDPLLLPNDLREVESRSE